MNIRVFCLFISVIVHQNPENMGAGFKQLAPIMAKKIKPLSAIQVRNAKPKEKAYKLFDGKGLYLEVLPSGSKLWRLKFRGEAGKENRISFGAYPDVSLEQAREKRDEARKLKASGIDPSENRKAVKAAKQNKAGNSFEVIAREWHARQSDVVAEKTAKNILSRLEKDVFPWIGSKPIADLTAPDYLIVFRKLEDRGILETAHRVRGMCGQIQRYAIATGRAIHDPIAALRGALQPFKTKHLAAVTEPVQAGELLRMIDGYTGSYIVGSAMKMAPYVFVRPGELRMAQWADIDLGKGEWRYMVTKTNTPHVVPLSKQVVAILKDLHILTGHGQYVFPSERTTERPMSNNTINAAFRRMGISKDEMTAHGFRAMARTILDEVLGERPDLIEHQLAHMVKDPNGRAYNRTAHLPERKRMMQRWADYLDRLKTGAEIISIKRYRQL